MVEALCKKSGEVAGHGAICLCKSGFGHKSSPPTLPSSAISKFYVMSSFRYRSFGSCKSWSFLDSRSPGLFELRDVCVQSNETLDQNSGRQGFCFLLPSFHGMEGVSKRQDSGRNRPGPERLRSESQLGDPVHINFSSLGFLFAVCEVISTKNVCLLLFVLDYESTVCSRTYSSKYAWYMGDAEH